MDKKQLIAQIISQLQADLDMNIAAAHEAREAATHEESVAENQYDTLGLEASYLAHGQSKRVQALEIDLTACRAMPQREVTENSAIALGTLVTLENEAGAVKRLFLGPAGGGVQVTEMAETVTVITPQSPIGQALTGRYRGDIVTLPQGEFEITAIS
ncbi:GreA/GreB family elongation factor [Amphritea pacifica]|uniref:GreA/GreB family elongation factor n=1 Tax=Amphritea pacifica TaxID=2811233 RepID=A0ABS2WB24_9GAMM|nr:GreA/GreB family elongation factor [Amphritea pacifica]MBN0988884.1 GreA/GreB family elongation factor [Amphritea pacifica]MBN1006904.1 GreA/GreB family elongation factor [Amphritea pacifica]